MIDKLCVSDMTSSSSLLPKNRTLVTYKMLVERRSNVEDPELKDGLIKLQDDKMKLLHLYFGASDLQIFCRRHEEHLFVEVHLNVDKPWSHSNNLLVVTARDKELGLLDHCVVEKLPQEVPMKILDDEDNKACEFTLWISVVIDYSDVWCPSSVFRDLRECCGILEGLNCEGSFSTDFKTLLTTPACPCDTILLFNDQVLPCHKLVLCTRSSVLNAQLNGQLNKVDEEGRNVIDWSSFSHLPEQTAHAFLEFIYCDKFAYTEELALPLLQVADFYKLHKLMLLCTYHMCQDMVKSYKMTEDVFRVTAAMASHSDECFITACAAKEVILIMRPYFAIKDEELVLENEEERRDKLLADSW